MMTDVDDAAKSADARTLVPCCSATMPCAYGFKKPLIEKDS